MTRRAAAILLLVLAAMVGGLLMATRGRSTARGDRRPRMFLRVTPSPAAEPAASTTAIPVETVRVTLFFPGAEDGKLRPEERDISRPAGAGSFLKALFVELQKGPTLPGLVRVVPEKIQLRTAFLLPEGEVVLDLAKDAGLSFGSAEELAIIASVVNTTLQNVADTNRVRILINGEPAETLGGHMDLTRPLLYLRREIAS